ncbi:hypothetical protein ACN5YO_004506 [Vibrio parahaemolyticus]
MKSREAFDDCLFARDEFTKAILSGEHQKARILWFSCLTLLRSIGHVLHKVDSKKYSDVFRKQLDESYKHWKENEPIFRDFIEKERNEILKEYSFSLEVEETIKRKQIVTKNGRALVTGKGSKLVAKVSLTSLVKSKGYLSGDTPLSALNEALDWWDNQLKKFESLL